ncbi:unnamed protein product [Pleuronectes platessa]|uniref:Uncharacterized protein n=1 Tax=Pleuronectes platessa TaxID=8262 RepID=A0A9N7TKN4_PLEPL|nr:unnamed protein product [Pleuronectes platessa]
MTWPFILNTVSPWPSVRKWLLILALNLPPVNVRREAAEVRELGQLHSLALRPVQLISAPPHRQPPTGRFSPGGACSWSSRDEKPSVRQHSRACKSQAQTCPVSGHTEERDAIAGRPDEWVARRAVTKTNAHPLLAEPKVVEEPEGKRRRKKNIRLS